MVSSLVHRFSSGTAEERLLWHSGHRRPMPGTFLMFFATGTKGNLLYDSNLSSERSEWACLKSMREKTKDAKFGAGLNFQLSEILSLVFCTNSLPYIVCHAASEPLQ